MFGGVLMKGVFAASLMLLMLIAVCGSAMASIQTVSFLYEDGFLGVDGDTSSWSTGNKYADTVNLGTNTLSILGGTAHVYAYADGNNGSISQLGCCGLGVWGQENDEIDSRAAAERIEVVFDTPQYINYMETRLLFRADGVDSNTEHGDVDFYLGSTKIKHEEMVGNLTSGMGFWIKPFNEPYPLADKIVFYVNKGAKYSEWSEFSLAKIKIREYNDQPECRFEKIYTPTSGMDRSFSEHDWQEYNNNALTQADLLAIRYSDNSFMRSDYPWAPWVYYEWDYIEYNFDIDTSEMRNIEDVILMNEWKSDKDLNKSFGRTHSTVWNSEGWTAYPMTVPDPNSEIYEGISVGDEIDTVEEAGSFKLRFKTATEWNPPHDWNTTYWSYTFHDYVAVKVQYESFCDITFNSPEDGSYQDGETLLEWEYGPCCDITHDYEINYKKGDCSKLGGWTYLDTVGIGETSLLWDSSALGTNPEECAQYCVEILDKAEYFIHGTARGTTGLFYIDNVAPHANILGPSTGDIGEQIHFYSTGSYDNCGIKEYLWNFDDGSLDSYDENPTHAFNDLGEYDVTLKVTDYSDNSDTAHHSINIDEGQPPVPPETLKTVGDPKTQWDGSGSVFYPEETSQCGEGMDCWKVTINTPITMDCIDTYEPIGDAEVCYYVEVDKNNVTKQYCSGALTNGFCCTNAPKTIYFAEESEHKLKFFCTDASDKNSSMDEEMFKVEGTAFEIKINKKWNLISVPFVLLNDDVEEVIKGIEANVESVWTYDPFTDKWYVYRPAHPEISDLEQIKPGWGYWIMAYADDELIVGGSLFSPIHTPESKTIKAGWNLIGFFGTEGLPSYNGPDLSGNGKEAYFALCSLGETWWDKGFTSLVTYWEPDNPNQWKYLDKHSYMNPGAGYWMLAQEDGIYSYTTACEWIFE